MRTSLRPVHDIGPHPFTYEPQWVLGVDLGQMMDATALAVVQTVVTRRWFKADWDPELRSKIEGIEHRIRRVERLPLGMAYPLQAEYLRGRLRDPALPRGGVDLVVDATGLGLPIVQILEAAGLKPIAVTITSGQEESQAGARAWRVPKELLINRVNAALHSGEAVFPEDLEDASGLKRELADFQVSYTAAGHLTWAARPGAHDDRVMAVAVGLWWAHRRAGGTGFATQPLLGI